MTQPTHRERVKAYFLPCSDGTPEDIAAHFAADAAVSDTNIAPMRSAKGIGTASLKCASGGAVHAGRSTQSCPTVNSPRSSGR